MSRPRRRPRGVLVVPPLPRLRPPPADNRAPIPWAAHRASFDAHQADQHAGTIGRGCRVCQRYAAATTDAAIAAERADQQP
jgi:hypothetical protein